MTKESNKRGRPTKFKEEYVDLAYKLTLLGHTDKELAIFFEVDESTINRWKLEHPEFRESIKNGKDLADVQVVESLRKRALGYQYKEIKEESGDQGSKLTTTTKEIPPDTTAAIFWLKNRQPKAWRDKQDIEHSGGVQVETRSIKDIFDKNG